MESARRAAEARECRVRRFFRVRGFTLTELLAVMAIVTLCAALIPALSGSFKGTSLNSGIRTTMNLLTVARTEAITRRQLVRFAIATDWPDGDSSGYRRVSLWASPTGEDWNQIGRWEELPVGVLFYQGADEYLGADARPATESILNQTPAPTFSTKVRSKDVTMRFVEFTPGGAIRANGANGYEIWFALATTEDIARAPSNWAVLAANIYTGRFRCTRPGE